MALVYIKILLIKVSFIELRFKLKKEAVNELGWVITLRSAMVQLNFVCKTGLY